MSELLKYLFDICGIDASPDDTSPEEALRLIRDALSPIKTKLINERVDDAIAAHKLRPDEKEWARGMAQEYGLNVFASFVKLRKPESALSMRLNRAASASGGMTEIERKIARQMGVSEATFAKYNARQDGAGDAGRSISQIQAEINRKLGVKPDVFAKYNGEARR
jgi:DNA invertase Pin-like site-specific DNA recombinase